MADFPKPRVLVSRCITFDSCRWNGHTISSEVVETLKPHLDVVTPCPETDLGLGVPRQPIRLIDRKGSLRLVQSDTGLDLTEQMEDHIKGILDSLPELDGFILKHKSPTCGTKNVKVYPRHGKVQALRANELGCFGRAVMERFPLLPVEDEGRLKNFSIREHWLTRVFALARFRAAAKEGRMRDIIHFHSQNKYLLMAYHQAELRTLGKVVANHEKKPVEEVFAAYFTGFRRALAKAARYTSNINVLMHIMGHFSKQLKAKEKAFILDSLERYRSGKVPLSVPLTLLKSYVVRYDDEYLEQTSFFEPYPEEMMEITDSGKGRRY